MNASFKNTKTYKNLEKQINAECSKFQKDDCTLSVIIALIGGIVFCFNWLGKVWDWIYMPQETVGWCFLAMCGSALAIIIAFSIAFIVGEIINLILSEIYFKLKFKCALNEEENYNRMQNEYRDQMDDTFADFKHFYPSEWILKNGKPEPKNYREMEFKVH